jgi:glutamyl-tRNA synthetase
MSDQLIPDLPLKWLFTAVEGQVVTRFCPKPNEYLCIGHVKPVVLSYNFSKENGGKMILRFDDACPSHDTANLTDSIINDLSLLGICPDSVTYSSDYLGLMQQYMELMISNGDAYLYNSQVDQMYQARFDGVECPCREQTPKANLTIWRKFLLGEASNYCVKGKIPMLGRLKDPELYHFSRTQHARTGATQTAYPTHIFATPVLDSIEGVTHAWLVDEHDYRNDLYNWVLQRLSLRPVLVFEYTRISFTYTVLGKYKLQRLLDRLDVDGWTDPRLPTVQGIIRRGMQAQTLHKFMISRGTSKSTSHIDWGVLWAMNRVAVDWIAPRYTALSEETLCVLELENGPEATLTQQHPLHPKNSGLGLKNVHYVSRVLLELADAEQIQLGEKITLMKWGNVIVTDVGLSEDTFQGALLHLKLKGRLVLDDSCYKQTKKITWLPALEGGLVGVTLVEYDYLITKANVEPYDDLNSILNINSKSTRYALAEPAFQGVTPGLCIQLERKSFFRVDRTPLTSEGRHLDPSIELIAIPDGKATKAAKVSESGSIKARRAEKTLSKAASDAHSS